MNQEEEYTSEEITSLSQLTKEEFDRLISSTNPHAKLYRDYARKEFQYRINSYKELNAFVKELRGNPS